MQIGFVSHIRSRRLFVGWASPPDFFHRWPRLGSFCAFYIRNACAQAGNGTGDNGVVDSDQHPHLPIPRRLGPPSLFTCQLWSASAYSKGIIPKPHVRCQLKSVPAATGDTEGSEVHPWARIARMHTDSGAETGNWPPTTSSSPQRTQRDLERFSAATKGKKGTCGPAAPGWGLPITAEGGCAARPPRPFLPGTQDVAPLQCRGNGSADER